MARKYLASGIPVYSNVPIVGCFQITKSDLGKFNIPFGLLIWDEVGIDFNNRDFGETFSKKSGGLKSLEWFKKHRHEQVEVMILSQGFDDMDKKLRDLASDMFIVQHSLLPYFTVARRISKKPKIDTEQTHQPIDFYDYVPFASKRIFNPSVWKFFDSFDRMGLPAKGWNFYGGFPSGVVISSPPLSSSKPPEAETERSEAAGHLHVVQNS